MLKSIKLFAVTCGFMLCFWGKANALPIQYNFDLTATSASSAFGGIAANSVFSGSVFLDPAFPNLSDGDGSLTNLLVNINGSVFDQNVATSCDFCSASTNFDTDPLPFLASDPNGFVDILVRDLNVAGVGRLWISNFSSNDITWFANDVSGARVDGTFTISAAPISAVPLPAALPFLLSALGFFGLIGWRRKRGSAAA